MLKQRVLTAILLLAAFLSALFLLPQFWWTNLIFVTILSALYEWSRLSQFSKSAATVYLLLSTLLLGILFFFFNLPDATDRNADFLFWVYVVAVAFWSICAPLWMGFGWKVKAVLPLAMVGWIILLPMGVALISLRGKSPLLLLFILGAVWIADSAAYFSGRRFGKHKLAPSISPGKTWEGVIGGLIAIALYGLLGILWANNTATIAHISLNKGLMIILLLWVFTALGVIGDLFESMFKRQAGVKDSGGLLPGHGGILDRIDAVTAALPAAALSVLLFVR